MLNISQISCCAKGAILHLFSCHSVNELYSRGKLPASCTLTKFSRYIISFRLISTVKVVIFYSAIKILTYTIHTAIFALILLQLHSYLLTTLSCYNSSDIR